MILDCWEVAQNIAVRTTIVEDFLEFLIDHFKNDADILLPGEDERLKCLRSSEEETNCAVFHTESSGTLDP